MLWCNLHFFVPTRISTNHYIFSIDSFQLPSCLALTITLFQPVRVILSFWLYWTHVCLDFQFVFASPLYWTKSRLKLCWRFDYRHYCCFFALTIQLAPFFHWWWHLIVDSFVPNPTQMHGYLQLIFLNGLTSFQVEISSPNFLFANQRPLIFTLKVSFSYFKVVFLARECKLSFLCHLTHFLATWVYLFGLIHSANMHSVLSLLPNTE